MAKLLARLAVLIALALAAPAMAQISPVIPSGTFPKPPDVPAYVPVDMVYATGTNLNVDKDPDTDTPPVYATELAASTTPATTGWTTTSAGTQCLTVLNGGPCQEAKFRTHSNVTHVLKDDPIRNWGLPGTSHCHMFFGNQTVNAFSTFAELRTFDVKMRGSASAGGSVNSTGYWKPCLQVTIGGQLYAIPPGVITIYYQESPGNADKTYSIPVGMRYVLGYDMDNENRMTDIVAAANAAAGWARYRLHQSSTNTTKNYHSFGCNGASADVFKNADNSDPFGGVCTAGQLIQISVQGPRCMDGKNLWSPGGYLHFIQEIYDTHESRLVCPNTYYRTAGLQLNFSWLSPGFAGDTGYGNWSFASDAMANGGAGVLPGYSFHTDWFDGWNTTIRRQWEEHCIGSNWLGDGVPHECNDSAVFDDGVNTTNLIRAENAPDGSRSPQVPFLTPGDVSNTNTLFEVPAASSGPATIHVHGAWLELPNWSLPANDNEAEQKAA